MSRAASREWRVAELSGAMLSGAASRARHSASVQVSSSSCSTSAASIGNCCSCVMRDRTAITARRAFSPAVAELESPHAFKSRNRDDTSVSGTAGAGWDAGASAETSSAPDRCDGLGPSRSGAAPSLGGVASGASTLARRSNSSSSAAARGSRWLRCSQVCTICARACSEDLGNSDA